MNPASGAGPELAPGTHHPGAGARGPVERRHPDGAPSSHSIPGNKLFLWSQILFFMVTIEIQMSEPEIVGAEITVCPRCNILVVFVFGNLG